MRRKILFASLLVIAGFRLWGASLDVYTDVSESYAGQPVKLTVRIVSGKSADRPSLPEINGFDIKEAGESRYEESYLGGGVRSKKITVEYTWILIPALTGRFAIPPITVTADKETLTSKPVILNIKEPEEIEGYHLFLTTGVEKSFPMIPIRVTLKWLFSSDVSRPDFVIPFLKDDRLKIHDLSAPSTSTSDIYQFSVDGHTVFAVQSAEIYEGKQYASLSMSWDVYAQKPGLLNLSPLLISFQRGVISSSGRKSYENSVIPSNSLTVDIQDLPDDLANFPGGILVADKSLQVSASLDQNRIYPGDPLELTLQFQGLNSPDLTDFKGIDGMEELTGIISADSAGISSESAGGVKTVRQKIRFITSNPREFPALSFPYFNLETGRVEECMSSPVPVKVQKLEEANSVPPTDEKTYAAESSGFKENDDEMEYIPQISDPGTSSNSVFYRYRVPAIFILLVVILISLSGYNARDIFRMPLKRRNATETAELKNALMDYGKNPDRDQAQKIYSRFWLWLSSLSDNYPFDKTELLLHMKSKLSPELYNDLYELADFLEGFWQSEVAASWKPNYPDIPSRVLREMIRRKK